MTKADILKKTLGVTPSTEFGGIAIASKFEVALDEYAKQRGEEFLKWVVDNHFVPNKSNLFFDYTLSREEVRFYTIPQLWGWFDTGVKFELPPLPDFLKL